MIEAGQLRHRVTIERPTRTEHPATGERLLAWQDVATVWAGVRPLTAREAAANAQTQANVTHEVTMRYTSALTADCRLRFGGRVLDITGIRNVDERNRELRVSAVEKT
jgi:SPP1 family predicted phage head-tail adaptor